MNDIPSNIATKEDIAELRTELRSDFATKKDIAELRSATKEDIAELRSELHHTADNLRERMEKLEGRMDERFQNLEEKIHDSQTELLRAFYGFTETVRQRLQGHDQAESRVLEIEKRLNMPPGL